MAEPDEIRCLGSGCLVGGRFIARGWRHPAWRTVGVSAEAAPDREDGPGLRCEATGDAPPSATVDTTDEGAPEVEVSVHWPGAGEAQGRIEVAPRLRSLGSLNQDATSTVLIATARTALLATCRSALRCTVALANRSTGQVSALPELTLGTGFVLRDGRLAYHAGAHVWLIGPEGIEARHQAPAPVGGFVEFDGEVGFFSQRAETAQTHPLPFLTFAGEHGQLRFHTPRRVCRRTVAGGATARLHGYPTIRGNGASRATSDIADQWTTVVTLGGESCLEGLAGSGEAEGGAALRCSEATD